MASSLLQQLAYPRQHKVFPLHLLLTVLLVPQGVIATGIKDQQLLDHPVCEALSLTVLLFEDIQLVFFWLAAI